MSNKAAWITSPKAYPLKVDDAPMPKAGAGEVVVKNHAVAINPVDWKIQTSGMFLQKYPNVLGTDVAGEVYEVGEGVTHVKKGDRVIGHAFSLVTNSPTNGAFANYTLLNALAISKIPTSLSYTSAAVLPLSISTAAACLYKREALALPLPNTSPKPTNKSVLIWGGSTSVGASAIQLAAASGLVVLSVASSHNLPKLKELGAKHVFDYKSSDVADQIVEAVKGSGTEFAGVCDCIGTPDAPGVWGKVYEKLGGRYGSVMPDAEGLPQGIEGTSVFAPMVCLADRYIGEVVWAKYIPEALANGTFKAKPDATVVGNGLEKIQDGVDELKKGNVSFAKYVVTL